MEKKLFNFKVKAKEDMFDIIQSELDAQNKIEIAKIKNNYMLSSFNVHVSDPTKPYQITYTP